MDRWSAESWREVILVGGFSGVRSVTPEGPCGAPLGERCFFSADEVGVQCKNAQSIVSELDDSDRPEFGDARTGNPGAGKPGRAIIRLHLPIDVERIHPQMNGCGPRFQRPPVVYTPFPEDFQMDSSEGRGFVRVDGSAHPDQAERKATE